MARSSQRFVTGCFVLFLATFGIVEGFSDGFQRSNEQIRLLAALGVVWSSTVWLQGDAEARNFKLPFNFGFILWIFWPFPQIWYLFKVRGLRAFYVLMLFLVEFVGAAMIGFSLTSR